MTSGWKGTGPHKYSEVNCVFALAAAVASTYLAIQIFKPITTGSKATDFSSFLKHSANNKGMAGLQPH